nr:type-F conjugative transfer system protein TraW [Sphingomonas sp. ID1715]
MLLTGLSAPTAAKDYGQHGAVFPVIEDDLLATIQSKLIAMQASGALDRANRQLAARTEAHVRRPPRVTGIAAATETRRWTYDPTITVEKDLRDGQGRVVVHAGTRVNPLDTVPLRQKLVFLDGDDAAQVAWARAHTTALDAKLILVAGSPFDLMKAEQRRFYFDQSGTLTRHFGIHAVPALVEQTGRTLRITELLIPRAKGDQR